MRHMDEQYDVVMKHKRTVIISIIVIVLTAIVACAICLLPQSHESDTQYYTFNKKVYDADKDAYYIYISEESRPSPAAKYSDCLYR